MLRRATVLAAVLGLVLYTFGTAAATERARRCFGAAISPGGGGTAASETFYGTNGDDVIHSGGGNDVIYGYGGNDLLCGGRGADIIYGGKGQDGLNGGGGNDRLYGGHGNDDLYGRRGKDKLIGQAGNDFLYGGAKKDVLKGKAGDDSLYGQGGNDKLLGGGGNDYLLGHPGYDRVNGGPGVNTCDSRDDVLVNCGGGGGATMQTGLPSTYGDYTLNQGFLPDPVTYPATSGGPVDVFAQLGGVCNGFAAQAPDFQFTYNGSASLFRFYFVTDNASADTTLIINDPNGTWHCNDDAGLGVNWRNPMIDFTPGIWGVYDVWIGSLNSGQGWSGTLYVTELGGNTP